MVRGCLSFCGCRKFRFSEEMLTSFCGTILCDKAAPSCGKRQTVIIDKTKKNQVDRFFSYKRVISWKYSASACNIKLCTI